MKMVLFLFLCFHLLASSPDLSNSILHEPLVISLGPNCGITGIIREKNLRKAAYPLDWILSIDFSGLIAMLDDDFSFFFDDRYLQPDKGGLLFHHYYHLEFSHEGNFLTASNFQEKCEALKEKYSRRVNRLREVMNYQGPVFFIRTYYSDPSITNPWYQNPSNFEITEHSSLALYHSLKRFFPKTHFTLLILNGPRFEGDTETFKVNENLYIFRSVTRLFEAIKP